MKGGWRDEVVKGEGLIGEGGVQMRAEECSGRFRKGGSVTGTRSAPENFVCCHTPTGHVNAFMTHVWPRPGF